MSAVVIVTGCTSINPISWPETITDKNKSVSLSTEKEEGTALYCSYTRWGAGPQGFTLYIKTVTTTFDTTHLAPDLQEHLKSSQLSCR